MGVLRVSGRDARAFLQGQLSNDVTRLTPGQSLLAGYHNPQGRVIALLRLLALEEETLLALAPRELLTPLLARLGRFVLRSRVRLADDSAAWAIEGALVDGSAATEAVPGPAGVVRADGGSLLVQTGATATRLLVVRPAGAASPSGAVLGAREWQLGMIAAGEPQVYAATSEAFVAQMLNLDVLDAIAFDKGCYTGQEVIARAHYRGRVKRRMQRFEAEGPLALAPGSTGRLADGRGFIVVEAAPREDGLTEFLAVAALAGVGASLAEEAENAAPVTALAARPLPLPYALPE
jgi:tRNA-modifying protein YgfZ